MDAWAVCSAVTSGFLRLTVVDTERLTIRYIGNLECRIMDRMAPNTRTRVQAHERFKDMPCRECGKPMQVGSSTRNQPRHFECGIKVMIEAQRQMAQGSGPAFDKWLAGCMARAREPQSTTPPPGK